MRTRRALVIGIGSPLRGDDGAGHEVVERLRSNGTAGVELLTVHQLLPELAERLGACDLVVFVDASISAPAGSVTARRLDPGASPRGIRAGTLLVGHAFPPEQLIGVAAALYGRRPEAWLVEIGAQAFELDRGVSDAVRGALEEAVAEVERLLRSA
jgi:hydrogenase maturation protease